MPVTTPTELMLAMAESALDHIPPAPEATKVVTAVVHRDESPEIKQETGLGFIVII